MKSRRRHATVDAVVDPLPFDYTLLSHLYVHSDGTDVIDFGGFAPGKESRGRVNSFLKNRSFAPGAFPAVVPEAKGSYLHLRVGNDEGNSVDGPVDYTPRPPSQVPSSLHHNEDASNLVRIEDKAEHWWLMCQASEDTAPFARQFRHADDLGRYLEAHDMRLPTGELSDEEDENAHGNANSDSKGHSRGVQSSNNNASASAHNSAGAAGAAPVLPLAKWLDVQIDRSHPHSAERVGRLLDLLPISQATKDSCLYFSAGDSIDINSVAAGDASDNTSGYVFLNLMCTPVMETEGETEHEDGDATSSSSPSQSAKKKGFLPHFGGSSSGAAGAHKKDKKQQKKNAHGSRAAGAPAAAHAYNQTPVTRSVMEMRFEAVRVGAPRSSVPESVAVAVIVFADWMFTIHEKPFAEMDDLLRMVQLHCAPPELTAPHLRYNALLSPSMRRRFTTPFIMCAFLQIAVGHHLDSITLAQAVDELGDFVFDIKEKQQDQDAVVRRITAVRRCFGECGADTARREVLFASLLQPVFSDQFFVADPAIRRELENAQAHLWHFQREISDCRDTVAISNWYHNVAIQWVLLRRGNRALRMVLLLTEVANIMYPIVMLQTLYAMNVRVPFEAEADPPNTSLAPFFVLAAVFLIYSSLTVRVVRSLLVRKPFQTRLLA